MADLDVLGENLGAMKPDWFGDCIHICAPGERETTLCGQRVAGVPDACSLDSGHKPTELNGCWTCLSKSNRWALPPLPQGET